MTENEAIMVLNAVPGIGTRRLRALMQVFGSARAVLEQTQTSLRDAGCPPGLTKSLTEFTRDEFLKNEHRRLARKGVSVMTWLDEDYPRRLKLIPDPPVLLYVMGQREALNCASLAIVGSRRATMYGTSMSESLSRQLTRKGWSVVSGLARGIDTHAHRGCVRENGVTVAVVGCGLENVYPPENASLMKQICERGAVVSEFPMTARPLSGHFPRRNRVISGLSEGIVVVEAARRSGALITVNFALEQGREVFAVPGPANSPVSEGVHALIQDGARLILSAEDIIETLGTRRIVEEPPGEKRRGIPPSPETTSALQSKDTPPSDALLSRFSFDDPLSIEQVSPENDPSLRPRLLKLQMKGLIRQLPGQRYVRVRAAKSPAGQVT